MVKPFFLDSLIMSTGYIFWEKTKIEFLITPTQK